jgi:uroporphyrinogen decarboxylase
MRTADGLSAKERILRVMRREPTDRVVVFPTVHHVSTRAAGETIKRFATDAGVMSSCLIKAYERFRYDGIEVGVDAVIEAEALGSEVSYPEDEPPFVVRPLLGENKGALRDLKRPCDPARSGRMPVVIDATKTISRHVGTAVYVQSIVMGPMNIASQLRGVENLILDFLDDPDYARELLELTLRQSIVYARALLEAGATGLDIGEAICSMNTISPAIYRGFALEAHKALIKDIHEHGGKAELHVCGDTTAILDDLCTTGADYLDIDWPVDMGLACSKMPCRGNLDPSRVLLLGEKSMVLQEARAVIAKAAASRGLILGSGCEIAPGTPLENISAMVEAAQQGAVPR